MARTSHISQLTTKDTKGPQKAIPPCLKSENGIAVNNTNDCHLSKKTFFTLTELSNKAIWEREPVLYMWYVTSIQEICTHTKIKNHFSGFLGGAVAGSLPANAGDTGSSPGLGGSHMLRGGWARAPQLLGLRSGPRKPQLLNPVGLEPGLRNWGGHHNEKPACRNGDPMQPKINK